MKLRETRGRWGRVCLWVCLLCLTPVSLCRDFSFAAIPFQGMGSLQLQALPDPSRGARGQVRLCRAVLKGVDAHWKPDLLLSSDFLIPPFPVLLHFSEAAEISSVALQQGWLQVP